MVIKFYDLAKRDGWTDLRTYGAMERWTDTPAYWDAMDASKNKFNIIF
mgnify:CR=1 FL=1